MGIPKLFEKINETDNILQVKKTERGTSDLANLKLAVDVSLWLHQSIRGCVDHFNPVKDPHLTTIFHRICILLALGIQPLVVFDGKRFPAQKRRVANALVPRLSQILAEDKPCREIVPSQLSPNFASSSWSQKGEMARIIADCQELLSYLGVGCVEAEGEAEAECARLEMADVVDGTITEDLDYLLFGGRNLFLFDFSNTCPLVRQLRMEDMERVLGLTREKLICLALLIGCDYTRGVGKIGVVKALKILASESFAHLDPFVSIRRFRDHCQCESDEVIKSRSRWQRLGCEFPDDFASSEVVELFLRPVTGSSPRSRNRNSVGTIREEKLKEFAALRMGKAKWKMEGKANGIEKVNRELKRINKWRRLREKRLQKEQADLKAKADQKKQPDMRNFFPVKKRAQKRKAIEEKEEEVQVLAVLKKKTSKSTN